MRTDLGEKLQEYKDESEGSCISSQVQSHKWRLREYQSEAGHLRVPYLFPSQMLWEPPKVQDTCRAWKAQTCSLQKRANPISLGHMMPSLNCGFSNPFGILGNSLKRKCESLLTMICFGEDNRPLQASWFAQKGRIFKNFETCTHNIMQFTYGAGILVPQLVLMQDFLAEASSAPSVVQPGG